MTARLLVIPTPIGNLGDITMRALEYLSAADVVYAEDTRRTGVLLQHFGIKKPLRSLFVGNERARSDAALSELLAGRTVALVSDAGTPGISDPGAILIQAAIAQGIPVEALPGPQAMLPALLLSGLPPAPFAFLGFLPRTRTQRRAALADTAGLALTLVFYEAPHRLAAMLADCSAVLGERPAAVVREISKLHEEARRATLGELAAWAKEEPPRGEIVVVVGGAPKSPRELETVNLADFVAQGIARGETPAAIARAAKSYGHTRQEAYREALRQSGKSDG